MEAIPISDVILASMTDGVVTLDSKGLISGMNPAAAEILGLDPNESVGVSYAQVFFSLPENDDFNQLLLDLVASQEVNPYAEVAFVRSDGETRHLALTTSLLGSEGVRTGAVLVFKDITAVYNLRIQRDELSRELAAKHEELKKAYLDLEGQNKSLKETQRRVFWIKMGSGLLGLLLFAAMIVFVVWGDGDKSFEAMPKSIDKQGKVQLRTHTVNTGDIKVTVSCRGFIEPLKLVTVSTDVAGRIIERSVALGQRVEKGDVLFRLDPSEVLPKVRQAEGTLLKASQRVHELKTWAQRPEFKQARRALELAKLDLERKESRFKESEALYKKGIIPRDDLVNARNDLRRGQSDLAGAEERLLTAKERGSPDKLRVAALELLNAKAALSEAKAKLAATVVKAPASGVVMRYTAKKSGKPEAIPELGEKVPAGRSLLTIGADQPLGVRAKVDEVEIRRIRLNQRVLVSGQALGKPLEGFVRSVDPQAVMENRIPVFPVIVELKPLDPGRLKGIRLGMSASVRIIVQEAEKAVLVPIVAVKQHQGKASVRIKKGDEILWLPVKTGISDHEFVQVKKGLKPGQKVMY